MTPAFRYSLLWLLGSAVMIAAALSTLQSSYIDGQFIPSNADAFYHARRILDSLFSGQPIAQFDARMHVPEGSWLTWPWGYDTLLTEIVRWFGPFANEAQANRILMNLPVAAAPLAVGLVVLIARQLALPGLHATLFVLAFACLPLAYLAFAVGNIDHHFAELLWTLATLSAGIWFFREDRVSVGGALVLGGVLGSAVAIHNGLFILQLPIAAQFGWLWLRGERLPDAKAVFAFAATLAIVTLLACIPSEPWRRGLFEFYTLSWFHVYVAACVAVFCTLMSVFQRTGVRVAMLAAAIVLALLPIAASMRIAGQFVAGDLDSLQRIVEVFSPYELYRIYGPSLSTQSFSWLLWLTFPFLVLNLWWIWRPRDRAQQFVAFAGAMGLALLQLQSRFAVFGLTFMLLTPLLAAQWAAEARPALRRHVGAAVVVLFFVAFIPTYGSWRAERTLGGDPGYPYVRSVFPVLKALCAARPGVVLGDLNGGHWVRYHSDCSCIANVFLLTPQHAAKARLNSRLMDMTPAQLLANDKMVRYVFAHHALTVHATGDPANPETPNLAAYTPLLQPLEATLLDPRAVIPPQFVLRWQVETAAGQLYGRLFEIVRDE